MTRLNPRPPHVTGSLIQSAQFRPERLGPCCTLQLNRSHQTLEPCVCSADRAPALGSSKELDGVWTFMKTRSQRSGRLKFTSFLCLYKATKVLRTNYAPAWTPKPGLTGLWNVSLLQQKPWEDCGDWSCSLHANSPPPLPFCKAHLFFTCISKTDFRLLFGLLSSVAASSNCTSSSLILWFESWCHLNTRKQSLRIRYMSQQSGS